MTTQSNNSERNYWAIVPAAGVGSRMASQTPKQYLKLLNKPIIEHSLQRLLDHPKITGLVVALGDHDEYWSDVVLNTNKPVLRVNGGAERCHSVLNALNTLIESHEKNLNIKANDWVLVHDAARPCIRHQDIDSLIDSVDKHAVGGLLALPVRDTMKRQDSSRHVSETVDRNGLWHALTPQMFPLQILRDAIDDAVASDSLITDESSAIERTGSKPLLVEGHEDNIKITRPVDIKLAEMFMKAQLHE